MPVSTKQIIDSANISVANAASTPIELMQAAEGTNVAQTVFSVPYLESLPSVAENKGRMVWVADIKEYRYSDGYSWLSDMSSSIHYSNTLWSWGTNSVGQLGISTTTNASSPTIVSGGITNWSIVSAGNTFTIGGTLTGTILAWGCNGNGQLGNLSTVQSASPVSIVGGFTDWCQVSAGFAHSAAIRTNGTLWSWGAGTSGAKGDNTVANISSPVSVVGGFTDWCQVSAGSNNSLAVRTNGTLWAWGCNTNGQLGDGTVISKSSPVSVVGGFTDWCQVSAGNAHSAAVRSNGTIWAWGSNAAGKLGDGTSSNKSSPVSVVGGFTDWCQVSAGSAHTIGIKQNGTIWAWGSSSSGQLGDGTTVSKSSPVSVVGGFTDWCQVSAGGFTSAAIRTNGTIWAWGNNSAGQLGDNSTSNKSSPVSVVGGFTDWCSINLSYAALAIRKQQIGF